MGVLRLSSVLGRWQTLFEARRTGELGAFATAINRRRRFFGCPSPDDPPIEIDGSGRAGNGAVPRSERALLSLMKTRSPEVFVSATSADLFSCRQLIKNALLTIGCKPVEQTNFPTDYRSICDMLRAKIEKCDAVVHVAGVCYGFEPAQPPAGGPRRSYTQMEYDFAREMGKRVYVLVCGDGFPYDNHPGEDAEKRELQQRHRAHQ
jgi:hypothetical protein